MTVFQQSKFALRSLFPIDAAILSAMALLASATTASAHVTLEKTVAVAGAGYKAVFRVGHGCEGSPTVTLRVKVPDGVINAKPMPKAGWTVSTVRGPYDKPYDYYGRQQIEGAREFVWTGRLPDDQYDEFVVNAYVTKAATVGTALYFPVVQQCETGSHDWVEIPAAGQDSHALKGPAPFIRIMAPEGQAAAAPLKVGALAIAHLWMREPPGAATAAGGYMTITNEGRTADRLLAVEGDAAARIEVHEMSNADGVMRMRQLDRGLALEPGQTIELKPGGYHVMFMGLKQPASAGQSIPATLVFEQAGRVPVSFGVEAVAGTQEHKH